MDRKRDQETGRSLLNIHNRRCQTDDWIIRDDRDWCGCCHTHCRVINFILCVTFCACAIPATTPNVVASLAATQTVVATVIAATVATTTAAVATPSAAPIAVLLSSLLNVHHSGLILLFIHTYHN